jgi:hypothetical protein
MREEVKSSSKNPCKSPIRALTGRFDAASRPGGGTSRAGELRCSRRRAHSTSHVSAWREGAAPGRRYAPGRRVRPGVVPDDPGDMVRGLGVANRRSAASSRILTEKRARGLTCSSRSLYTKQRSICSRRAGRARLWWPLGASRRIVGAFFCAPRADAPRDATDSVYCCRRGRHELCS